MKSKQQKYEEACARNVTRSLGKEKYTVPNKSPEDFVNGMRFIKNCLGIRVNDSKYDAEIKVRINGKG